LPWGDVPEIQAQSQAACETKPAGLALASIPALAALDGVDTADFEFVADFGEPESIQPELLSVGSVTSDDI
jgi:hypothetical protein